MSGDLDDIRSSKKQLKNEPSKNLKSIRAALPILENLKAQYKLSAKDKQQLQAAGDELAGFAIEQGGNYLNDLQKLKAIIDDTLKEEKREVSLNELQKTFWQLIQLETSPTQNQANGQRNLRDLFLNEMNQL